MLVTRGELVALERELNSIGVNVNQIAHALNVIVAAMDSIDDVDTRFYLNNARAAADLVEPLVERTWDLVDAIWDRVEVHMLGGRR